MDNKTLYLAHVPIVHSGKRGPGNVSKRTKYHVKYSCVHKITICTVKRAHGRLSMTFTNLLLTGYEHTLESVNVIHSCNRLSMAIGMIV